MVNLILISIPFIFHFYLGWTVLFVCIAIVRYRFNKNVPLFLFSLVGTRSKPFCSNAVLCVWTIICSE